LKTKEKNILKRVTGIGGIFFKSKDPKSLKKWYREHLGIPSGDYGWSFYWQDENQNDEKGYTVWSPFPKDSNYFQPTEKEFMVNFRVDDLYVLLEELKKEGVRVIDETEESEFGKFGWIIDPDGTKIELWEPPKTGKKPKK